MSGTGQKEQEQMDIQDKTKKTGTESIKNRTYVRVKDGQRPVKKEPVERRHSRKKL